MIDFDLVKAELDSEGSKKKTMSESLAVLFFTLLLFFGSGLLESSISHVFFIILVIFVHECGHYLGMLKFKYRDVKMFFIPFLGAAVSGKETNPSSFKKAIVSLLGPTPGIIISIILIFLSDYFKSKLMLDISGFFLLINCFNLLPIHALDGGRFCEYIIFSRSAFCEIAFKVITTLALIWFSYTFKIYVLGIFAVLMLINIKNERITTKVAKALSKDIESSEGFSLVEIPDEYVKKITDNLNEQYLGTNYNKPTIYVNLIRSSWERICNKPASAKETILLITIYLFVWAIALFGAWNYTIKAKSHMNSYSKAEHIEANKKSFMKSCTNGNQEAHNFCQCVLDYTIPMGIFDIKNKDEMKKFMEKPSVIENTNRCRDKYKPVK